MPPRFDGPALRRLRQRWRALTISQGRPPEGPFLAQLDDHVDRLLAEACLEATADEAEALNGLAALWRLAALAWATPGSRWHAQPMLARQLSAALAGALRGAYAPGGAAPGNWWYWEIGLPLSLLDTALLLGPALPQAHRARLAEAVGSFTPNPLWLRRGQAPSTGANRAWACAVTLRRALLAQDAALLSAARTALFALFRRVRQGDGLDQDGSFLQHGVFPYSGGYGVDLMRHASEMLNLLHGSPWAVPQAAWSTLRHALIQDFAPLMQGGAMLDMVRGREISRAEVPGLSAGRGMLAAALSMAACAPPAQARRLRGLAGLWLRSAGPDRLLRHEPAHHAHRLTPGVVAMAEAVLRDAPPPPAPQPHRQFPGMDRVVHRRPGFLLGLAMHSTRIASFEAINGENLRGWFTAHGHVALHVPPDAPEDAGLWPTVDATRLPGTTVRAGPRRPRQGAARRGAACVGGAALDEIGIAGMHLVADERQLGARKSWLMVGDAVLALGSGIQGKGGAVVETVLENRILGPGRACILGNALGRRLVLPAGAAEPGGEEEEADAWAEWAHLEGVGGYLLLDSRRPLRALRERRQGAWRELNEAGPEQMLERDYATLWLDHGADPRHGGYAYVMLPGAAPEDMPGLAAARGGFTVVKADAQLHLARHDAAGVVAAMIWQVPPDRGLKQAGPFAVSHPAALILQRRRQTVRLGCADPTQALEQPMRVTVAASAARVLRADPGIEVALQENAVELRIDFRNALGRTKSLTIELRG